MYRIRKKSDFVLFLIGFLTSVYLSFLIKNLSFTTKAFPLFVILALGLVSFWGLVHTVYFSMPNMKKEEKTIQNTINKRPKLFYTLTGALIYVLLMPLVGFYVSSFIFLVVLIKLLGSEKNILVFISTIVFLGCLYGVFSKFLHVPLPKGMFF